MVEIGADPAFKPSILERRKRETRGRQGGGTHKEIEIEEQVSIEGKSHTKNKKRTMGEGHTQREGCTKRGEKRTCTPGINK